MVAGVSMLVRSSFIVEPVRAGQEVRAEVATMSGISPKAETGVIEAAKPGRAEPSKGERSPMTFARTAFMADEASTRTLLEMVARAEIPLEDTSARSRAKAAAKRRPHVIDIGHVPSGLEDPDPTDIPPARTKRSDTPKTRKLAEKNEFSRLVAWE
jgi:hypothetical protein